MFKQARASETRTGNFQEYVGHYLGTHCTRALFGEMVIYVHANATFTHTLTILIIMLIFYT